MNRPNSTTPSRRAAPNGSAGSKARPSSASQTAPGASRKLPFQARPEQGPKHRRPEVAGLSRAVVPVRNTNAHFEGAGLETTSQRILNEQLVRLTTLLLRSQSARTSHDSAAVRDYAYQRAHEVVDDELSRIITKLVNMQGPSPMHRIVALSQLSTSLTKDVERAIFTDERAFLANFTNEQRVRAEESALAHASFSQELAARDQSIASLHADKAELESRCAALTRRCEALDKELDKAARNQAQTHQNAVELRMQGLDFKARVDNRCARILASIQSRMGFIPAGIQKQVLYLKVLKAPGDPAYDETRLNAQSRPSKKRFELPGEKRRWESGSSGIGGGSFGRLNGSSLREEQQQRPSSAGKQQQHLNGRTTQAAQLSFAGGIGIGRRSLIVSDAQLRYTHSEDQDAEQQYEDEGEEEEEFDDEDGDEENEEDEEERVAEVEMTELHRRPRSQEDWVRWALNHNQAQGNDVFDDEINDELNDEDDEEDDNEEGEEEFDYEDDDDTETEAKRSDYLFLHTQMNRPNGSSVLGER